MKYSLKGMSFFFYLTASFFFSVVVYDIQIRVEKTLPHTVWTSHLVGIKSLKMQLEKWCLNPALSVALL